MKGKIKSVLIVVFLAAVMLCAAVGFTACNLIDNMLNSFNSAKVNGIADSIALAMLGNNAFNWNVFSVDPKGSFGYEKNGEYSWYEYSPVDEKEIAEAYDSFKSLYDEIKKINVSRLGRKDAITYRSLDSMLYTYTSYYGSRYAKDFELIGGSYIGAEGGYVADFASSVENFVFRRESDMQDLLEITQSTKEAFSTYADYAADRIEAGYPLYDHTLNEMQDYLNDILDQGEGYYLYDVLKNKINAVDFLSAAKKAEYISAFEAAIKDGFIDGARLLCEGLEQYKGNVVVTDKSYLAAYGEAGRAYYQWKFEQITGIKNADIDDVYDEMSEYVEDFKTLKNSVVEYAETLKESQPEISDDFNAYLAGEKSFASMQTPEDIMLFLTEASKKIVPDLKTMPDIDFKYMDETVAGRTSTMAYYLKSPLDSKNAPEHITLNPNYLNDDYSVLFTTMAHEGYPGHLYAHVKAKESDLSLLSLVDTCQAFSEGWAVYASVAILGTLAVSTQDEAVSLYCQYYLYNIASSYMESALEDILFNYYGYGVSDFDDESVEEGAVRSAIEWYMENPAAYISYGYGIYYLYKLHVNAGSALAEKYDEVALNGALLAEEIGRAHV